MAVQIVERLLGDGNCPPYLHDPAYGPAVRAWARSEAKALLLYRYLEGLTPEQQLTPRKGGSRSPLEQWRALEQTAATHRARLGLDPLSRSRLARDIAQSRVDMAQVMAQLRDDEQDDDGS